EPAVERLPLERLVAVPVVLGGGDERDNAHARRLRTLDGLRQRQPLSFGCARRRMVQLGHGRQRPHPPVRLADRNERRRRAEALERGYEPAVDRGRAETERGVVVAELERRGIGFDELDPILELRLSAALPGGGEELRRALDAGESAP